MTDGTGRTVRVMSDSCTAFPADMIVQPYDMLSWMDVCMCCGIPTVS